MKRLLVLIPIVIICIYSLFIPVYAEEDLSSEIGLDISAADEAVPSDAAEIIEEKGISADNIDAINNIGPSDVLKFMVKQIKGKIQYPLKVFVMILKKNWLITMNKIIQI